MTGSRTTGLSKPLFLLVFGAFSSSVLTPDLLAQSAAPDKTEREVEFVLALAQDMRFISLAQSQVERLQAEKHDAHDQDHIAQVGIAVAFYGAKTSSDRAQQRQRYKETIDKSKELLERTSDPSVQSKARATLADACQEFGQFLNDEITIAQTESPEKVPELETEAAAVFKAGIEACDRVMTDLEAAARKDRHGPKAIERGVVWLRKGILLREQGRAVKADRGFLIERAKSTLEEMVFEYGEETALGLRGLFEMAQCDELAGHTKEAIDKYQGTIKQISTSLEDKEGTLQLNAETQAFLFNMQQEVFSHLADMLFQQGDTAACEQLIAQFENNLKTFGEKDLDALDVADPRYGHLTFLVKARLLAESGDPEKVKAALELVKKINDRPEHANDFVGVRAKSVIRDILVAQQSLVSGKLLFDVAKGDYQNNDFEKAIKGMRRALASLSKAEMAEFGAEAYTMLGLSFARSNRLLEAVIAFQTGLQNVGKSGDEDTQKLAEWLDKAMSQLNAATKKDAAFADLTAASDSLVKQYGSESQGDPRHWQKGEEAMRAAQLATDPKERKQHAQEALAEYQAVSKEYLRYEEARVRVAVALTMAGDIAGAQKVVDDYRKWLETKEAVLDPRDSGRQQVRTYAVTEADFRDAVLQYDIATGVAEGSQRDLTKYPAAIDALNAFLSNHKDSSDQMQAFALDHLGRLHSARGDLDKAEEAYARLKAKDPAGGTAARLATVIFDDYITLIANLEKELDKASGQSEDRNAVQAIRTQLTAARQKLASLGSEYMKNSSQPQIGIMVHTMAQYEELGDWPRVGEIAEQVLQIYGDSKDEDTKGYVDRVALPKAGEALLQQGKWQLAYDKLIAAEKANPTLWELKRLIARALGGWYDLDNLGAPAIKVGLGKPIEAYEKYWGEYKKWGLRPEVKEYSYEWYQFYWEAYWYARQAAAKDSKYLAFARTLYSKAKSINNFATLKALPGDKARKLTQFFVNNTISK